MLDHERLDVYRTSIEFAGLAFHLIGQLPRGQAALADQFRRAAMSVPLNIAEGNGRSGGDRVHHLRIARGSATECGAIVDVLRLLEVAPIEQIDRGKELLVRVVSMLSKMCR
jgi:four helix bundle protein